MNIERFNNFFYGFLPGLLVPVLFMWVYILKYFPGDHSFIDIIRYLYPSDLFGKLLLLSSMPNLAIVFAFYKADSYRLAAGVMCAALPFFIASTFFL